jgi:hypothetical protein
MKYVIEVSIRREGNILERVKHLRRPNFAPGAFSGSLLVSCDEKELAWSS